MALDLEDPTPTATRKPPKKAKVQKMDKNSELVSLDKKLMSKDAKALREKMKKKYGEHTLYGVDKPMEPIQVIPTGFKDLDLRCIGNGNPAKAGFPKGFFIEVFGKPSGGKTTLVMSYVARCQRLLNLHVVYIDLEKSMDVDYARANGIDPERWDYLVPDDGEDACQMALEWIEVADLVIVDSFGMVHSKAQLAKEIGEANIYADQANLINSLVIRAAGPLYRHKNQLIAINQIRSVANAKAFQKQTKACGGFKVEHIYGLRLEVGKGEKIQQGSKLIGIEMKVEVVKNKIGPPGAKTVLPIIYGQGVSAFAAMFEEAVNMGVIEKHGASYSFAGEILGQGRDNARKALEGNPEWRAKIEAAISNKDVVNDYETVEDVNNIDPEDYNVEVDVNLDAE